MQINYDDLVEYLDRSEDWHQLGTDAKWLTYNGPNDAGGEPVQIALPSSPNFSDIQPLMEMAVGTLAAVENTSRDDMADRITPTSVKALMDAIKAFDCEPSVFNVSVQASDHRADYAAYVDFRTYGKHAARGVSTNGESPEEALQSLFDVLKARWGRCPHCGQPLRGKAPQKMLRQFANEGRAERVWPA